MVSLIMSNVIMLSVIMLNVMAPSKGDILSIIQGMLKGEVSLYR